MNGEYEVKCECDNVALRDEPCYNIAEANFIYQKGQLISIQKYTHG